MTIKVFQSLIVQLVQGGFKMKDILEKKQVWLNHRHKSCTLDGQPAVICGWKNDFATIVTLDNKLRGEWTWAAVNRIMERDGSFLL